MDKIGKTQSITRQFNNEYVLSILKDNPCSGTELADMLSLSNATISSILKSFLQIGIIKQHDSVSNFNKGRKRVVYSINSDYGCILSVCISNYSAILSIADICGHIKGAEEFEVEQYNAKSFDLIIEKAKALFENTKCGVLKEIVVSLPGRVNAKTGELELSTQFDDELFKEKNYIQKQFSKAFEGVNTYIANDINLSCVGEMKSGKLKGVENAIYIAVDTGIGGALVINGKLFAGDFGFSGEFGLLKHNNTLIDNICSLRCLKDKAISMFGKNNIRVRNLPEFYKENQEFKNEVLNSARVLGDALFDIIQILDIQKIIISGRVRNFGEEYIEVVKEELSQYIYEPDVSFSEIDSPEVVGNITAGINYTLKRIAEETRYDK